MINKKNWQETQNKWNNYWNRKNTGRPLMRVIAELEDKRDIEKEKELKPKDMKDKYLNPERIVERYRYFCETHKFLGESFPNLSIDFGPGSLAAYLGSEVVFNEDTVWFEECVDDWNNYKKLEYDPENTWFKKHIDLFKQVKELAGNDFLVCIPDIMENIDVLSSMRGAQNTIFDMMDEPDEVKERINQVDDLYFQYYDQFYNIVKDEEGGSCYTVFQIWGPGKTAKLQCDFSAMISPNQFREFIKDSLEKQAKLLDYVIYHLDGPDAIHHLDALMEIEEIDALQWTSGDYGPDGTFEEWYDIYDKAVDAGKGLWVKVYSGKFEEWLERLDKLVARYGSNALFLYFDPMPIDQANRLLEHAEKNWSDVKGSYQKN